MYQPLADKIRPKTLDDVVGQRHLLGKNGLLRRVIESGTIPNMIFYGPSGLLTGRHQVHQMDSGTMSIAPQGHSLAQMPQPLQYS